MILCFFAKSIRWGLLRSLLFLDQRSTCCYSIWSLLVIWILSCRLILGCGFTCEASSSSFLNGFCCNSWLSSCRKHMHLGFLWVEDQPSMVLQRQVKFWSFHIASTLKDAMGFGFGFQWILPTQAFETFWVCSAEHKTTLLVMGVSSTGVYEKDFAHHCQPKWRRQTLMSWT